MKQQTIRIGSLCTGYGGLDMAILSIFGGRLVWCADNDKHVAVVLDARYPDIPNLGDLTRLDWGTAESVEVISAGFPCQDISYNGRGAGIEKGARSGIWKNIMEGIRILRPKLVVVENVAGIRGRGLDRVLGDLAEEGYYAAWTSLRASDVGTPHRRERVFILGYRPGARKILAAAYARIQRRPRWPVTGEATSWRASGGSERPRASTVPAAADGQTSPTSDIAWGRYGEAIRRWEAVTGRSAPLPVERGVQGQTRLASAFSEWLMGLPSGFVTGLGLPYGAQQRILGNGVVPQQATAALRMLVGIAVEGHCLPPAGEGQ